MFSLKHIIILIVCTAYIVMYLKGKQASLKKVLHRLLGVGILSETLKIITYIIINEDEYGGYLPKTNPPHRRSGRAAHTDFIIHQQRDHGPEFLYHSSIVTYAIFLYETDEISFTLRDYRNCLLMLYAFFFVAICLNGWANDYSHPVNFMYVVNPPVEGLPLLTKKYG